MANPVLRRLLAIAALAGAALIDPAADAAEFPIKPLRVIVPFAPGGNTSFVMRVVAQPLEANLGQPVVIDHRSGAQGLLGLQLGAQSSQDGYTIALSDSASVIAPAMMDKPPFDVLRSQFLSLLTSNAAAFVRVLDAKVKKEQPAA